MQNKMKTLLKRTLSGLFLLLLMACSSPTSEKTAGKLSANTALEAKIEGMTCEHGCVTTIKKQLGKMDGVYHYDIDFQNKSTVIEFNKEQISADEIVKKIESLNEGAYKVNNETVKCIADCDASVEKKSSSSSSKTSSEQQIKHDGFQIPSIFDLLIFLLN